MCNCRRLTPSRDRVKGHFSVLLSQHLCRFISACHAKSMTTCQMTTCQMIFQRLQTQCCNNLSKTHFVAASVWCMTACQSDNCSKQLVVLYNYCFSKYMLCTCHCTTFTPDAHFLYEYETGSLGSDMLLHNISVNSN